MEPLRLASLNHPGSCLHPLFVPFYGWVVLPSTQGQSILIMGAFRVFKLTSLLKCMTPPWILMVLSRVLTDMCRMVRNWNCLMCTFSVEVAQGDTLPSCFSSQPVNTCFSWALLCRLFLHLCVCVLFLGDLAKWSPRAVLPRCLVSRVRKAVKCLMEKTRVRLALIRHEL